LASEKNGAIRKKPYTFHQKNRKCALRATQESAGSHPLQSPRHFLKREQ
jgi:hypothetical protein